MSDLPINQNVVPLLHGLKPYMGSGGQVLADGVISVIKLLASNHGQEAIGAMSRVFTAPGKGTKTITVNTGAGPVTFSLNMVFVLFLILILLLLSGNLLAFNPGGYPGGLYQPPEPEGTSV